MSVKQLYERELKWVFAILIVLMILPSFIPGLWGTATAAQVDATWVGGIGNWNTPGNWDIGIVPNNGVGGNTYNVFIDGGKILNSSVNLDINATIDNLTIDAGDSLVINNGKSLTLASGVGAGTITNSGTIAINRGIWRRKVDKRRQHNPGCRTDLPNVSYQPGNYHCQPDH
jgi:hypothetical protein